MNERQRAIVRRFIAEGRKLWRSPRTTVDFATGSRRSESLLNDIDEHPHMFVLACVMDRQIRADRAWIIPYRIGREIGGFSFRRYLALSHRDVLRLFSQKKLHRFNTKMADCFYSAVQDIHTKYNDDASRIWTNRPRSATVIRRFLEFKGVGPKIATMATNILALQFKIPMDEYSSIDISADVQVRKFFTHHKLLRPGASNEELIYLARELYPECPGLLDLPAWSAGRQIVKNSKPERWSMSVLR